MFVVNVVSGFSDVSAARVDSMTPSSGRERNFPSILIRQRQVRLWEGANIVEIGYTVLNLQYVESVVGGIEGDLTPRYE